jgi:hypothetical protein
MKFTMMALVTLLNATVAMADCLPLYEKKIKTLSAKMENFKTNIVSNVIAEGALVGGLAVATGTVAVGGVLVIPAMTVASGTYLGALAIQRKKLMKAHQIISQAQNGKGLELKKFLTDFDKNDRAEVIQLIVEGSADESFCSENVLTGKMKLMTPTQIKRFLNSGNAAN